MKALTANRLADGEVIFWNAGAWVERFAEAELFADQAAADAAEARAKVEVKLLVDPYLIDVDDADGEGPAPLSYRERLRALGPSNKPDHGKQAAGGDDIAVLAHAHGAARSKGRVDLIRRK
jgi:sulfite reductase (NADPH) hemoprotein beta-component